MLPAVWALVSKVLPLVIGAMGAKGGEQQQNSQQSITQPQSQFIPPQMMQSRQMPSYGGIIQQMLAKQRGGM